jgi:hypothetical protein
MKSQVSAIQPEHVSFLKRLAANLRSRHSPLVRIVVVSNAERRNSVIVGVTALGDKDGAYAAGYHPGPAPDCDGLRMEDVRSPLRMFDILRGTTFVLLIYYSDPTELRSFWRSQSQISAKNISAPYFSC